MPPEDRREFHQRDWRHGHARRWRAARRAGPLRRAQGDRLVGGVAAGVAAWTGIDVTIVRIGFMVAALASGFGAAAYVLAWLILPAAGENRTIVEGALRDRRGLALAAGLGSVLLVVAFIASAFGAGWLGSLAAPLFITAAGLVLISRNASADEQAEIRRISNSVLGGSAANRSRRTGWRLSIGAVLLIGGLATVLSGHTSRAVLRPLGGVALVIAAIVVALGPWWLRIARDLVVERQARARAEERAEMAARVHDSVLQTLALIQLHADEPQRVVQLARAQERELRSWLFNGPTSGAMAGVADGLTVAAGVRLIQQEVEAQHGVSVEAVTVGDAEIDDDLGALLAAAREATVNAAKWSGAPVVSVFAEVEPALVSVFVRDRGRGFDPATVPADRKGLAESIRARMARRGGNANVRSVSGQGTEVALRMPRTARDRQQSRS